MLLIQKSGAPRRFAGSCREHRLVFREGETLEHARLPLTAEAFREQRNELRHRIEESSLFLEELGPILHCDDRQIGSPMRERLSRITLSDEEYLQRWEQTVKTPDQFIAFEEQFADPLHPSRRFGVTQEMEKQIRERGKDICGVREMQRSLEAEYGITIDTDPPSDDDTRYQPLPVRSMPERLSLLRSQLETYPRTFIRSMKLRTIRLCETMQTRADDGSRAWVETRGYCQYASNTLSVSSRETSFVLHHELFHLADKDVTPAQNAEWATKAHGPQYQERQVYGKIARDRLLLAKDLDAARPDGFARLYGTATIDEDKATMADGMMRSPERYKLLQTWGENEQQRGNGALLWKMHLVRETYRKLSGGLMDDQFWIDYQSDVPINRAYWEKREKEVR